MTRGTGRVTWIIPGKLGGMRHPSDPNEVSLLAREGITGLISLTEEAASIGVAARREGMRWLHLPIQDFHAPELSQIDDAVRFINTELGKGGSVVVHCWAGVGRTGTILASYLVSQGELPDRAMERVRQKNPGSIETEKQEQAIREYHFERIWLSPR